MPLDVSKLKDKPARATAVAHAWANTFKPYVEQQLGI